MPRASRPSACYTLYAPYAAEKYAHVLPFDVIPVTEVYVLKADTSEANLERIARIYAAAGYTEEDYIQELELLMPEGLNPAE